MTQADQDRSNHERTLLGQRLRHLRIQAGITLTTAAKNSTVHETTWRGWEQGRSAYRPWRAPDIAQALGLPVAQLFTDELVLAEVRVSRETLERVRNQGRDASREAANRIAGQLEPLIYQAATAPPADVRPGARAAKKRRTRAQVLAGVRAANKARAHADERRTIQS